MGNAAHHDRKRKSTLYDIQIEQLQFMTTFDGKLLKRWYKNFHQVCPQEVMSIKEFAELFHLFFSPNDPTHFIENVFNAFDKDNDGQINFLDLVIGIHTAIKGSLEEKLNWAFDIFDVSNNGYVNQDQLIDVVVAVYTMRGDRSMVCPDRCKAEERGKLMFKMLDLNKDSKVDRKEFVNALKKSPGVSKLIEIRSLYERRPNI